MASISYYRNTQTGELAPPHVLGINEDGLKLYQYVEGWFPVDYDGNPVECDCDEDGNWISK